MSNKVIREKSKIQKKERAIKKAKQKKIIIIGVCTLLVAIISVVIIVINNAAEKKVTEIYSYQGQAVELLDDGKFTAILAHNVRKRGTYTKTNENDRIETGWIIHNSLHIPREWDDGHGHGSIFPKIR